METKGQVEDNPEGTKGQVDDNQGQTTNTPDSTDSQPDLVELPGGEKVTREELIAGYTKDADYRKKTAAIAEEKKRVEEERNRIEAEKQALYNQSLSSREEPEDERNPIEIMDARVQNLERAYLRNYLDGEIQKATSEFPDADTSAVFDVCWANPNANIKKEMERNQKRVIDARDGVTVDQILAKDPDAKKKYESNIINKYLAKKKQEAGGGVGSGTNETVIEEEKKKVGKNYKEIGNSLKERIKERESASELD